MVLINLHEKSRFLSEIMFIQINPYVHHRLTRYQSNLYIIYERYVRKKGCAFWEDCLESQQDDTNITHEFDLNPFDIQIGNSGTI